MLPLAFLILLGPVLAIRQEDPEVKMTTPQIIRRWGYPAMIYTVTTPDGYILELHRIPSGLKNSTWPNSKKPVVFLQHGLLCASSDWVMNLPDQSAGFLFADAGFDVWMGNMRGNTYSTKHKNLKPSSAKFWEWSWDEMVQYDLDTMIDFVLKTTNSSSLYYVGHSQGTLTMFSRLAKDGGNGNGRFGRKIKKFFALAPVGSVKNIKGMVAFFAHFFHLQIQAWFDIFGPGQFLPNNWAMKITAKYVCGGLDITSDLCDNVMFLIAGPQSDQWNSTRTPVYVSHVPAGTSTQNFVHWMQMVLRGGVPAYDWGRKVNRKKYGQANPPEYDFTKISNVKIHLYWSGADWLADKKDVTEYLLTRLDPTVIEENHYLENYNHLDFTWGTRAARDIYLPAIDVCVKDFLEN